MCDNIIMMITLHRNISPLTRPSTQDAFGANFVTRINTPEEAGPGAANKVEEDEDVFSEAALKRHQAAISLRDVVLEPQEMLALYSSDAQLDRGHTVMLHSLKCQNQNIFLTVETTCPLHRVHRHHLEPDRRQEQVLDMKDEDEGSQEEKLNTTSSSKETGSSEMERSVLPDWLQAELREAETDQRSNKKKQRKKKKARKGSKERGASHPHSVESEELTESQMERVRRMEREYERRQQEIMLEAEEAVRAREEALNQELARLREELERQRSLQTDYIQDKMGGRKGEEHQHSSGSCSLQ